MNEMKWIPVTESLPEQELTNTYKGNVLLCVRHKSKPENGTNIYIGKLRPIPEDDGSGNVFGVPCKGSDWTIWGWSYYSEPEVLAWMPLPEPYKGGDDE